MAQHDALWYRSDSNNRISDDQRNVLKDKAGFEGYTAYLEDYIKENPAYEELLMCWRQLNEWLQIHTTQRRYYCDILDLIKDENSMISVDLRCQTGSNSELFTALSEPREGVYGRIVTWRMPKDCFNPTDFLEDLGLVLNIGPAFVNSVLAKSSTRFPGLVHIPIFVASHVTVGDRVATMTRCSISEKSSAVPIALIADTTDPSLEPRRGVPIFEQLSTTRRSGTSEDWKLIMDIIERNSKFSESADALILPALFATMHMDVQSLRDSCNYRFKQGSLNAMSTDCNELRRRIEEFEDVMQDTLTGFNSLYGADWSQDYECKSTIEFFMETINRARRFEACVRDLCQARIGQLSLSESKKSIELSNSQIGEGKRVKIFTILAFVYVPLNLASSIFGMNIQQLNKSGQSIQTFLVTAVVILVFTGVSWLCTEQVNQYRSWSRRPIRNPSVLSSPRPTYNIAVRVRMLVWLYCNGYWVWVRKTNAWWYILANRRADRRTGFGSRLTIDDWFIHDSDRDLSAGAYVSKHMGSKHAFFAFRVESGGQNEG